MPYLSRYKKDSVRVPPRLIHAVSPLSLVKAICLATSASVTVFLLTSIARTKSLIVNSGSRSCSESTSVQAFSMAPGAPGEQGVNFLTLTVGSSGEGTSTCAKRMQGVSEERSAR